MSALTDAIGAMETIIADLRDRVVKLENTHTEPAPEPAPEPQPGPVRAVPLVGESRLPWNSIVFGVGTNGTALAQFEQWRNRPVDGILYFPARSTWADLRALPPRRDGDLMVYSIPPFPENVGGSTTKVVAGQYDADIATFARALIGAGWNTNRTIIRLGWESNGTWYQWSQNKPSPDAFKAAYRRFVNVARAAGLTGVAWNWCLNKGPQSYNSGTPWTTAYPGDDVVDVIGIDAYDFWSASYTDAQFAANTTNKNPGLQDVAAFVRSRGKLMSLDEWGVVNDPNGGGDNPFYIRKVFEFCKANADILAWDNTYDHDGAPSTFRHKLSNGQNPKAAAQYRTPWPNGWGG